MKDSASSPYRYTSLDGARIAYKVAGAGPAIVLIKNNRRPRDFGTVALLAEGFRVFRVHPVGFGASDRPPGYAFGDIAPQVLAVMDREGIERFVVWGFSQCAAMAAMVASSTDRAVALVAGGFGLLGVPTDATMRRMEREPRMPQPPLEFWRAYRAVDWHDALRDIARPKLVYVGSSDPACPGMRRNQPTLESCGCDYLEVPGLDHRTAGLSDCSEGARMSVAAVTDWLTAKLGSTW